MKVSQFITECENYSYSKEYFTLYKEACELDLASTMGIYTEATEEKKEGFFKKIWNGIISLLKKFWNWIKSFFTKNNPKDSIEKAQKAIEKERERSKLTTKKLEEEITDLKINLITVRAELKSASKYNKDKDGIIEDLRSNMREKQKEQWEELKEQEEKYEKRIKKLEEELKKERDHREKMKKFHKERNQTWKELNEMDRKSINTLQNIVADFDNKARGKIKEVLSKLKLTEDQKEIVKSIESELIARILKDKDNYGKQNADEKGIRIHLQQLKNLSSFDTSRILDITKLKGYDPITNRGFEKLMDIMTVRSEIFIPINGIPELNEIERVIRAIEKQYSDVSMRVAVLEGDPVDRVNKKLGREFKDLGEMVEEMNLRTSNTIKFYKEVYTLLRTSCNEVCNAFKS